MNTYELEREIDFILDTAVSAKQFKEGYEMLAKTALEYSVKYQALLEAVAETVSKDQVEAISLRIDELIEEHAWRNTTPEERKILSEYGYKKAIVPMEKEEIMFYFTIGEPVFLLGRDSTEILAESKEEIENHINSGGLCGVGQFSVDMVENYLEHREEDYNDLEEENN